MSDEAANPVVEPVEKEEVSTLSEDTTPKPDEQVLVEDQAEVVQEQPKTIPKERFDQVWARSKKAEAREKELEAQLQREREERIRLEERARVQQEQQTQKEYTWAELEHFISEGQITRDQAQEYKDKQTEARLRRELKAERERESSQSHLLSQIDQYKQLIPDVMVPGSEARQKYEQEYAYLVRTLGYKEDYATQLAATRAAFGDIERVKRTNQVKPSLTSKESFVETHTPPGQKLVTKAFKDTLPEYKVKHWEKMMKAGLVKSWKDVEDLEKWTPKVVGGRA